MAQNLFGPDEGVKVFIARGHKRRNSFSVGSESSHDIILQRFSEKIEARTRQAAGTVLSQCVWIYSPLNCILALRGQANGARTETLYLASRFAREVYRIVPQGVQMNNKKVAFITAVSTILLIAQGHIAYATDTSTDLFAAVNSGEMEKVGQLLAAGADPSARGQIGITPLMAAALGGRTNIAKLLVDRGADVNAKSDKGMTALMIAAAEGHKGLAQLLLDKGADANIPNPSGLTPFQIATATHHEDVAALLKPHTVSTRAPESALFGMKRRFVVTGLYPGLFATMALFFLVIGLRGMVTKKPFLISARWLYVLMLLGFGPAMLQAASLPTSSDGPGILGALRWMVPTLLIVVLVFLSFTMRGYIAFGVTDLSFREALLASLKKLNLDHEETMSLLRLPTIGADLQVAVQSWMGTAQIKIKQRQFRRVLVDIINNMNAYYKDSSISEINLTSCIFYVVMGVFFIVFAGVFLFAFSKVL
jgi:uncharacterized protein